MSVDLSKRIEEVEQILWGNHKPGIIRDVDKIKGDLYRNPDTGEQGLVADVRQIKTMVTELRGVARFGKAAVAIIGGALVLLQLADKLGWFTP